MSKPRAPRCKGRRRKMHGRTYGTFACGRKATAVVTTNVGFSRTTYVCDDPECWSHVTEGYPAVAKPLAS